jgi:hypothetical protein
MATSRVTKPVQNLPPYREPQGVAAAELHHVNPFDLLIDENYQRNLNGHMIKAMIATFDPALFGVLEVNYRTDDTLFVIDGQHRVHVARQLNLPTVPVRMHFGLTSEQEASMFVRFQSRRRAVTPLETYKAAVHSKDPEYVALDELIRTLGFQVGQANTSSDRLQRTIPSVATLVRIFRYDNGPLLERSLTLYDAAWMNSPGTITAQVLIGVAYLISRKGDEIDNTEFVRKLSTVRPTDILREVRSTQKSTSSTVVTQVALRILSIYNRGKRTKVVDGADMLVKAKPGTGGVAGGSAQNFNALNADPRGMSSYVPRKMMEQENS